MVTTPQTWVGRRLAGGRYRVTALLGEGGMGCVYQAHDANLDCEVVVKVPRPSLLDDPDFAGRFAREIRSLVRLAHPHVVKIIDVGTDEGVPFAVMQFLPGGSLEHRPGTAAPPALADWLGAVAEALDYIHGQGYVHRDIKPANILFDAHGNAYVGDFGVAKAVADRGAERRSASLTEAGMVLGTRHYMAPEMLLGHDYDGRIDQYALAVTVYQVLSGRLPFDGPTPAAILLQQTSEAAPLLHRVAPSVPREVSAAVARALDKDPGQRFPSCVALARAALGGRLVGPPSGGSFPRTPPEGGPTNLDRATADPKVTCPSCGKAYTLPARALRKKRLRCPVCQAVFPVTPPSEAERRRGPAAQTRPEIQAPIETGRVPSQREPAAVAPPEADSWPEDPKPEPGVGVRPGWTRVVGAAAAVVAVMLAGVGLWRGLAPSPVPQGEGRAAPAREEKPAAPVATEPGLLERAAAHAREHEYDRAIPLYQEALRLNSKSAVAHAGLAEAYLARRDTRQALGECTEALRLDGTLALAHVLRGRVSGIDKDYQGARAAYDEALRLQPKLAAAYAWRAVAQAALGNLDAALKDGDEALRLEPKLADAYIALSYARHLRGEDDLAAANGSEAIHLDPKYPLAYQTRGTAYQGKRDYDRALADYDQAVRLDPTFAYAYFCRGSARASRGENDRALADYDQAIALDPKNAEAYTGRAAASWARKDYDRALADCDAALGLDPSLVRAVLTRGLAHCGKGEYDRALADYARALQLEPNSALAHALRASAYLGRKDYEHALADSEAALRLDPKLALAFSNRGAARNAKGDADGAARDFTEALRLDPTDAGACRGRGGARAALKDFGGAIKDFTEALRLNPADVAAYNDRGRAYLLQPDRDYDHAIADFTEAIRLSPRDPLLHVARGDAYTMRGGFSVGDYDRAIADFSDAIRLDPAFAMAYNDLGSVYLFRREYDRAISNFNEALRLDPNNVRALTNRARAYEGKGNTQRAEEDRGTIRHITGNKNK
jgi:tetratricopeptide (TPR) repeat protein